MTSNARIPVKYLDLKREETESKTTNTKKLVTTHRCTKQTPLNWNDL